MDDLRGEVPLDSPMTIRPTSLLAGTTALVALALGSCGGGSDSGGGSLSLLSCSLGCSFSASGPANCAISDVFVNQVIWVEFTSPVDISSVTGTTFQVFNSITGQTPPGLYSIDPNNDRRVFFQPTLTFDSTGSPSFGFDQGESYEVRIPGRNTTPSGPVILSLSGQENQSELDCFVFADQGVSDIVTGPPEVTITIEELDDNGITVIGSQDAANATEVALNSRLRFQFNDVMNPSSLVNPALGTSDTISIAIDPDGDIANPEDQLDLPGNFQISVDIVGQVTEVLYTPEGGFPSAGGDLGNPRRVVVNLPQAIIDLGGNSLANSGERVFTTIALSFPQTTLGEDFTSSSKIDQARTGMILQPDAVTVESTPGGAINLTGRVLPGLGGGSGVLGDLVLEGGGVLVLSTDASIPTLLGPGLVTGPKDAMGASLDGNSDFDENAFFEDPNGWVERNPGIVGELHVQTTLIDNYFATGDAAGEGLVTVTDGAYEFSTIRLLPSSQLKFVGSNPARMFARGDMLLQGLIDVAGRTPVSETLVPPVALGEHISSEGFGGPGGTPGPNGGRGGKGGDRPDSTGTQLTGSPALKGFLHEPGATVDSDGSEAEGRGGVLVGMMGGDSGAGGGGTVWPAPLPGPNLLDLNGFEPDGLCSSQQVGAPGAGGSFSTFGQPGTYLVPGPSQPTPPPAAVPGADLVRAFEVNLDPDLGDGLVGGAGGGGGGAGIIGTKSNGSFILQCMTAIGFPPPPLAVLTYEDHSGAGGGGGGGAIQLQAGAGVSLGSSSSIRAGGGDGASAVDGSGLTTSDARAAPGGGGSGGAVLIQTIDITIASVPGLIDISGGAGGRSAALGAQPSVGGDASPGIVQIFNSPEVDLNAGVVANSINASAGVNEPGIPLSDYLLLDSWLGTPAGSATDGPSVSSGVQSCWLIPEGAVFSVDYIADDFDEDILGWEMKVQFAGLGVVNFRSKTGTAADLLGGVSLEEFLTSELGTSPLVVRFQGARTLAGLGDPCTAVEGDPLVVSSVTPWLKDPSELNTYWDNVPGIPAQVAAQRRPNVIRFQVVFDGSGLLAETIESIVELSIETQPN